MEVVSTLNLVSSENEKTAAFNFQTMVMPHDERPKKLCIYANMKLFVVKKHPKKHIYTEQQNQNRPAIS